MNPNALRRARESSGLTMRDLAKMVDVSQSILSQLESGRIKASNDLTLRMAKSLNVPVEFLVRTPWPVGEGSLGLLRAHTSKVKANEVLQIRQRTSVLVELVERLSEGYERRPVCLDRAIGERVVTAANSVRARLGYAPEEPISNLTRRVEKQGAVVLKSDLKRDAVFGYSVWVHGKVARPYIVISHFQTPYRARWTLAHELGHVVLGHEFTAIEPREAENQANQFAAALLVPPAAFLNDIEGGSSLSAFGHLKAKYGVSIAALIRRAYDLGLIDSSRYESLNVQISQKGWRKGEPGDDIAEYEEPVLLGQLIETRFGKGTTDEFIAAEMGLPFDIVHSCLSTSRAYLEDVRLRAWMAGEKLVVENDQTQDDSYQ